MNAHDFLVALTMVLCVAAFTTVVFQKLKQPVVLGYLLAGVIVGPFTPIPLVADRNIVQTLSELGVILLMFSLGLDFSIRRLLAVGPTAGLTALFQCSVMMWLGFTLGRLLDWTLMESIFAGAIISISSTTIIAKAFDEQGITGKLRELVVGVLIVEDLIAVLLITTLTAVSVGGGMSVGMFVSTTGKLILFLLAVVVVGLLLVPRIIRGVYAFHRTETLLVASIGICFAIALLAQEFGYSVALGAFIAGMLIAESGKGKEIEHLVLPVRDMFAAVFFVSVGMLIDPLLIVDYWKEVILFTLIVIVGQVASVSVGAFLTGNGARTSIQASMSLAQIGEFSFIIASVGTTLNATGDFLYPLAVAVSAITTLTTPWMIRASGPVANFVDKKLPKPLQTFVSLYGTWIENLKTSPDRTTVSSKIKRLAGWIAIDTVLLASLVIGVSLLVGPIASFIQKHSAFDDTTARIVMIILVIVAASPFLIMIFRMTRTLGAILAEAAMPNKATGRINLMAAPRRAFVVSLQLAVVLLVSLPLLALTQPFLPTGVGTFILLVLFVVLGINLWKSAASLHGHVRAVSEVIMEVLSKPLPDPDPQATSVFPTNPQTTDLLAEVKKLLPGVGEPMAYTIETDTDAVGKSLSQLNLRGLTGSTVLAINREGDVVIQSIAQEKLRVGDTLALAGTREAVEAARNLLGKKTLPKEV